MKVSTICNLGFTFAETKCCKPLIKTLKGMDMVFECIIKQHNRDEGKGKSK